MKALHVTPGSPADRIGIRGGANGDVVVKIAGVPIQKAIEVSQVLVSVGAWNKATYVVAARRGRIRGAADRGNGAAANYAALYWQYAVGMVYLGVGLFVFFRRGNAPRSLHFYTLCLASFILSAFHYTGKLNSFDKAMYYGNVLAGLFAPTIFLHFCLAFPEKRGWFRRRGADRSWSTCRRW